MRTLGLLLCLLVPHAARPACRDCAAGALGGPADNRFTVFDSPCTAQGCADPGQPQLLVNTANLNLHLRLVDLVFGGPTPAVSLEQAYNSDDQRPGPLGNGWTFSLSETLTQDADSSWVLRRGSGRIDRFGAAIDATQFFAITPTTDVLTRSADGGFMLRNAQSGTVRSFGPDGHLNTIADNGIPRAQLKYTAGLLTSALLRGTGTRVIQFTYTADGHLAAIADSAGRSLSFAYDNQGNLVQQSNADGSAVAYSYDGSGRLVAVTTGAGQWAIAYGSDPDFSGVASITLPDSSNWQYTAAGARQVQATDGAGNVITYTSAVPGQTQSITDAAGNTTAYTYDSAGHKLTTSNANGGNTSFGPYDGAGNLTKVTDPAQNAWTAAYSGSLLAAVADPLGHNWKFTYDTAGRLNALADPYGNGATLTRNAAGQVILSSDANGNQNLFQYDPDGLISKWTDPTGGNWSYQYDGAMRVAARTEPGGTTLQAGYDVQGRLQSVSGPGGGVTLDYSGIQRDALHRVAASADSFGNQIAYSYGPGGRLASITLPGGNAISYQYDATGRLAKVSDWLGDFALYKYDPTGLVSSVTVGAGPVTVYQYDSASNLRAVISVGGGGSMVAGYRYTVDAAGDRTSVSAAEPSTASLGVRSAVLSYGAGNLLVSNNAGQNYRYDASGRLIAIDGAAPATLTYDAVGRLSALSTNSGATQYSYDALGLRVERNAGGSVRRSAYDLSGARPRVVMETDGANNPAAYYVWGLGLLWKISAQDGQPYFYHFDGDGNVVAVSSSSGGVLNRYRYDPLGVLVASDESVENPFHARGESGWIDDGDGLLYGEGNYYAPELRRALPGKINLSPPDPAIVPKFPGAGACFIVGVADCAISSGRRVQ